MWPTVVFYVRTPYSSTYLVGKVCDLTVVFLLYNEIWSTDRCKTYFQYKITKIIKITLLVITQSTTPSQLRRSKKNMHLAVWLFFVIRKVVTFV